MKRARHNRAEKREQSRIESVQAAEPQLVRIEKPVYGGAFLARVEKKAIFVPLTMPGELARVRIVEDKRGYANAEVDEILEQAVERIAPECRHFGACGGCQYQHMDAKTQLTMKQAILRETLERGGVQAPVDIDVLAGEPWYYRNRIRLAVDSSCCLGYRSRRSHSIVAMEECPIAAPLLVSAAKAFAEVARAQQRMLRINEVTLFCNTEETQLLASVTAKSGDGVQFAALAHAWVERVPQLVGAELLVEDRGGEIKHGAAWGAGSLSYQAAGITYRVDHGAFFQVNRWLVDPLVKRVTAGETGGTAWDLYAGVGLFARQLTQSFERVIAVEPAPTATRALEHNLRGSSGEALTAQTLAFLRRSSREYPDLIVLDPPRTGLGAETTSLLMTIAAPTLVYVSCDPATLARDLKVLVGENYEIESVTMVDLFPQSFHLETVVRLRHS